MPERKQKKEPASLRTPTPRNLVFLFRLYCGSVMRNSYGLNNRPTKAQKLKNWAGSFLPTCSRGGTGG